MYDALERFEVIWANVECGISIIDAETREIIDVNPVAARMFGGDTSELIGKRCHKLICPAEEHSCPIMDKNQFDDRSERKFIKADGKAIPIIKAVAKINYNGRLALLESFNDISNLKKAENEALAANHAKSEFLARMSHEIRTPLNAIIGLSEVELRNDLGNDSRENLEKIYRSGNILLKIINDMLDISKIESGNLELVQGRYDFPSMISDTIHVNIIRIASKPVTFEPQIDDDIPVQLYGDEIRIKQILNNLLSNAFKYTEEGKVVLKISCVRLENEVTLEYEISDTGRGIEKENLGKLFSAYQQFDTWANRRIEGTGLGLAICKKLVDIMGGTIKVESEYGKGSRFVVRLTQGISDPTPIGAKVTENLRAFRSLYRRRNDMARDPILDKKILLVDDVITNLDVAKGLMAPYGLTIHCASSGKQAVEIIKKGKVRYDAVFMDHMMPEMDGIEAVRVIREEIGTEYAKTVPIIVLTANALVGSENMFLEKGFQAFLSKPIDVTKLDEILNEWVRKGLPQDTLQCVSGTNHSITKCRIEGVDLIAGVSRFGGEDAYLQIIRSYIAHTPALLEKLRNVSAKTLDQYAVVAHGLKGSSYGIFAAAVGKMAEDLESAAKRGQIEIVASDTDAFIRAVESLISRLSNLEKAVRNQASAVRKELKASPDKELLKKLLKCCLCYDVTGMEDVMSELGRYEYETQDDLVAWLGVQLNDLEYDNIRKRLENIGINESSDGEEPA